jgi:hypothetical protein
MIIKRKSTYSGKIRSKDIPVDPQDWAMYQSGFGPLYEVIPYLNNEDREFILSGITPDEWKTAFSEELKNIVEDTFI